MPQAAFRASMTSPHGSARKTVLFRSSTPRGPTDPRRCASRERWISATPTARLSTLRLICSTWNSTSGCAIDTPAEYDDLWDLFKPRGRVNAEVHLVRGHAGEPVDMSATVFCRDVGGVYRYFPYPLDHLTGQLKLEKNMLAVDLHTVGGQPIAPRRDDSEPGRGRRRQARYPGRGDPDRRATQESDAGRCAQGRRSIQTPRGGQGSRHRLPQATARPARPSRGS